MRQANALEAENQKLDQIKRIVDEAAGRISSGELGYEEAAQLAESVRAQVEKIVPDMMDTYDLIYAARFRRLIDQFVRHDA